MTTTTPRSLYNKNNIVSLLLILPVATLALAHQHPRPLQPVPIITTTTTTSTGSTSNNNKNNNTNLSLDVSRLQRTILQEGRVYQQYNFLSEVEVCTMLEEIQQLEVKGQFQKSGLANTATAAVNNSNNKVFGNTDRSLCPVPWWSDSLKGTIDNNNSSSTTNTHSGNQELLTIISSRIQNLRLALASILHRPTMTDASLDHECYYSVSTVGTFLSRHMDERHEELKGAKGWLLPSRRSLSWLIYLSDPPDWTLHEHGGALRTFPPKSTVSTKGREDGGITKTTLPSLTQDEGNLQIGWLLPAVNNKQQQQQQQQHQIPVYLDSWYPVSVPQGQPNTQSSAAAASSSLEPHCVLYTRNVRNGEMILLTKPWLTEALQGISVSDFLSTWAKRQSSTITTTTTTTTKQNGDVTKDGLFLQREYAQRFVLLEDRSAWNWKTNENDNHGANDKDQLVPPAGTRIEDIVPQRGSLVVFDSVTLPHQVERIYKGKRVALAGWFHEETQPFPIHMEVG